VELLFFLPNETLVSRSWNYSFIAWKLTKLRYSWLIIPRGQYIIVAGYNNTAWRHCDSKICCHNAVTLCCHLFISL